MTDTGSGQRKTDIRIVIGDPTGFPDSIANDLERVDAETAERVSIEYIEDSQKVVIEAEDHNAAKWLYDWLEETRQYYRENYVDASGEHDAARQMADRVYGVMSA